MPACSRGTGLLGNWRPLTRIDARCDSTRTDPHYSGHRIKSTSSWLDYDAGLDSKPIRSEMNICMVLVNRYWIRLAILISVSIGTPTKLVAEYRLEDYRANNYAVPSSKRDLWSITNGVVEARLDNLIAFHSRADQIFTTRPVAKNTEVSNFIESRQEIPPISFSLFRKMTVEQWMASQPVTGLLVLKGNTVLLERYQYDRSAQDKMLGNSMSKSIVGMLVGIALDEKSIGSIDDLAEKYEPRLKGHPYGTTTIRSLLTMTSGMSFVESRDNAELWRRTAGQSMVSRELESVKYLRQRAFAQGQQFNYNSVDTQVLTLVLIAATGKSLSEYMSEKLWKPIGAESPAFWMTDAAGTESGFVGFNATLRDWGRLGLLLANRGVVEGKQIISSKYLAEAQAWRPSGYGYHIWLSGKDTEQISLLGVRGQSIFVDPVSKIVMVITAVREREYAADTPFDTERVVIWKHVVSHFKK